MKQRVSHLASDSAYPHLCSPVCKKNNTGVENNPVYSIIQI